MTQHGGTPFIGGMLQALTSILALPIPPCPLRFSDSEVQRDAKLVSYQIVDKQTKPYIQGRRFVERRCMSSQREPLGWGWHQAGLGF